MLCGCRISTASENMPRIGSRFVTLAFLLVACGSEVTSEPLGVDATSRIIGVVNTDDGRPVAQARIFLEFPPRKLYGYATPEVWTNASGEFSYRVERTLRPPTIDVPDTVTVVVRAEISEAAAEGGPRTGRTPALLHFAPTGDPTPVVAVTVTLIQ